MSTVWVRLEIDGPPRAAREAVRAALSTDKLQDEVAEHECEGDGEEVHVRVLSALVVDSGAEAAEELDPPIVLTTRVYLADADGAALRARRHLNRLHGFRDGPIGPRRRAPCTD